MTCNTVILARPEAGTSVDYQIPTETSVDLHFQPGDIDGIRMTESGALEISFVQGGDLTIENFDSLIAGGNILRLADGTVVDPALLKSGLTTTLTAQSQAANDIVIEAPAEGVAHEISLENGQSYLFSFALDAPVSTQLQDGKFTMTFENGGQLVLSNYSEAMASSTPPQIAMDTQLCTATNTDLVNILTQLAMGETTIEEVIEEDGKAEDQGDIRQAAVEADTQESEMSPEQLAELETAAGAEEAVEELSEEEIAMEEVAEALADVEPAAGEPAGASNSGYGYGSRPGDVDLAGKGAIGAINATALNYEAPELTQVEPIIAQNADIDTTPEVTSPPVNALDESDLGPLVGTGQIIVDFGNDGPGSIVPNGTVQINGSTVQANRIFSGGEEVRFFQVQDGYEGRIGNDVLFSIEVNRLTGEYTYTQNGPFDHANEYDPDDEIEIRFGYTALDQDLDSANTFIVVKIADDAPLAINDGHTLVEDQVVTGNILDNDDLSNDVGNEITQIQINGDVFTMPASGSLTVTGLYGVLEIQENGDYAYTANHDNPDGTDVFRYTLRDFDGDTSAADLSFDVSPIDDVPVIIEDDIHTVDESDLGPIVVNGTVDVDYGTDGPGTVSGTNSFASGGSLLNDELTSGGVPVTVNYSASTGTYTGMAGSETIFTMTILEDGSYTFELLGTLDHADPDDPNDIIDLHFGVIAEDLDDDTAESMITIQVKDDVPTIGDSRGDVDETNLESGDLVYQDSVDHNLGAELGSIQTAGDMVATVGNNPVTLTSDGQDITVTRTTTGFEGQAGGQTVFTLTIDPDTGAYTYTQMAALDHPDGTDANDIITLNFPIEVITIDNDSDGALISIEVADDGVVAQDDINGVEEDQSITGSLMANDDLSVDLDNTVTNIHFDGTDHAVPAGGSVTITAEYGTITVASDGTYTYQTTAEDPDGVEEFTYTLTDGDGDNSTATLEVRVTPDGEPVAVHGEGNIDESLLSPGPLVLSGQVDVDYGADGTGSVAGNGNFSSSYALTSGGVAVVVSQTATGYVGMAGSETIFTLTIEDDGSYAFELEGTLDHAESTDPNDLVSLSFGVTASDADGDTVDGTIKINVLDDAPVAYNDFSGAEEDQFISGNVLHNDELSEDDANTVTKIMFDGTEYDVPETGVTTITADYGTFTIGSDGTWTYQATAEDPDGNELFTYILKDADGDENPADLNIRVTPDGEPIEITGEGIVDETSLTPGPAITHGTMNVDFGQDGYGSIETTGDFQATGSLTDLTHKGIPVNVTQTATGYVGMAGSTEIFELTINQDATYSFELFETLDHADPLDPNDAIKLDLGFGVTAVDVDGDTVNGYLTITILDDAPVARDDAFTVKSEGDADLSNQVSDTVLTNDELSEDDANSVTAVIFKGVKHDVPSGGSVTVNGDHGVLVIKADGQFTYTANDGLESEEQDTFTYHLTDSEGDTDTAELELTVQAAPDDAPIVVNAKDMVDETALENGTIVEVGKVNVDFGIDAPGSITGNGDFNVSGAFAGNKLTHDGKVVNVAYNANNGMYTGTAGGVKIFTLQIAQNGDYTFKQFQSLDHGNKDSANEALHLNFGVKATDDDGDTGTGTIKITVRDDGPKAVNDGTRSVNDGNTLTGNVLSNDDMGSDAGGKLSQITFDGNTYNVSVSGRTINTPNGKLIINQDGSYTYTSKEVNGTKTDTFTYTLKDGDGDTNTASFSFKVTDNDRPVIKDATKTVDETGGFDTVEGKVEVTSGDAWHTESANKFWSSTALKHDGRAVKVTSSETGYYEGKVEGGKAGDSLVFKLWIEEDGSYKFKQYKSLDHPNKNNADDPITLNFEVKVTDSDGDTDKGVIKIVVKDDGPKAKNDTIQDKGKVNLLSNDDFGQDGKDEQAVIRFKVGNKWYEAGQKVNTAFGKITVKENGTYELLSRKSTTETTQRVTRRWSDMTTDYEHVETTTTTTKLGGKINIVYEIRDDDGDTDTATVSVTMSQQVSKKVTTHLNQFTRPERGDGDGGDGSPLVLDLDRDGIEMTNVRDGITFDVDHTEDVDEAMIGWVEADDAWLAIDKNDDGQINDINELFGNTETEGYRELAELDTNDDGVIDANDEQWGELLAWRDLNQDGISQENELFSMEDVGITSISLQTIMTDYFLNGNWTAYESVITFADGSTSTMADVWSQYISVAAFQQVIDVLGEEAAYAWLDETYNTYTTFLDNSVFVIGEDGPVAIGSTDKVEEGDLENGPAIVENSLIVAYGEDEPGTVTGNGKFDVGGSLAGNELTHNGVAIAVAYDNGIYTGMAGDVQVFALNIQTDGTYSFTLYETLDHGGEASNLSDVIMLQFGLEVTDNEGDVSETAIRIRINDEGALIETQDEEEAPLFSEYGIEDSFLFETIGEAASTIREFNVAEGDSIDLSQLLDADGAETTEAIGDYVQMRTEDGNTIISVDTDGAAGPAEAQDVVVLEDTTGLDMADMLNDGNLVV